MVLHTDQFKQWILAFTPQHESEASVEYEPEQIFLLGSRWADYGLCFLFALMLPLLRYVLRTSIYEPLGSRLIGRYRGRPITGKQRMEWFRKWNESAWKMTVFTIFTVVAYLVSFQEKWFTDTRFYWLGCNHFPPCNLIVSKGVLFFYALETGFYIQSIHFLIFYEVRRKDWLESMVHHIAAVMLLAYSYYVNFTRPGVMVMLIHDVSDIFLEAAKLCRYAQYEAAGVTAFATFVLVWILTRVVYFPLVIIRSTLTEPLKYAAVEHVTNIEPHYTAFNGLLLTLLALHIYWTWLILKILWRRLFGGARLDDIREKKVEEEEEED